MDVVSPGANGHPPSSNQPSTIDPNLVVQHLVDLLEITLGASTQDLESPESILSAFKRDDTVQRCTRFASESQVALYVQKSSANQDKTNGTHSLSGIQSRERDVSKHIADPQAQKFPPTTSIRSRPR